MTTPTPYDEVHYPSLPYSQTHPDRLRTQGILRGMDPAPVDRCRVLELGCGAGGNLIPMALTLPGSEFIGVDLAGESIARGQATVAACGLTNITLRHQDLSELGAEVGQFDYIIAHGVYSWIPAPVRDRLMAICRERLNDQGIAFISYNLYPGWYTRQMMRDMLLYHTRNTESRARVAVAKDLLHLLAEGAPQPERYRQIARAELALIKEYGEDYYRHDTLSEVNDPVYFHEFIEHARRHQLQYLTEVDYSSDLDHYYAPPVMQELRRLGGGNRLELEQYCDFFGARGFRRTLLCRAEIALSAERQPRQVMRLAVQCAGRPVDRSPDLRSTAKAKFVTPSKQAMETSHPLAKAAIYVAGDQWPTPVPFPELLVKARARLGATPPADQPADDPAALELAEFLMIADNLRFLKLVSFVPHWVTTVSAKPVASPLVRWQVAAGLPVTNVWHAPLKIEDEVMRRLLALLDGTRDHPTLVGDLTVYMFANNIFILEHGQPIRDPVRVRQLLTESLQTNLAKFAGLCLLIG